MLGKHVYVQKPLTHTVYESRLLTRLADKNKLATQMGNQGSSGEGVSLVCEWLANGEIGEVTKVEAFTDRPIWPQGQNRPEPGQWVPDTLDWDLFIGPAPMRPYHPLYTPWNWRGWWDFGTGALGDMACHILHPVFTGLELGYPIKAQGSSTLLLNDCAPNAQMVKLVFPARTPKRPWKGMKRCSAERSGSDLVGWWFAANETRRLACRERHEQQRRRRYLPRYQRQAALRLLRERSLVAFRPCT
jgi:hypothetical protein